MAKFDMGTDRLDTDDLRVIRSYLYKLNQSLDYMFSHLTPEDNWSQEALYKYISDGEKATELRVDIDQISATMVDKDQIVTQINMSKEGVKIKGDKISLEGLVTVNSFFKVGLDGSIEARNGKFSGDITASNITGSTLTAGGTEDGKIVIQNASGAEIGRWDKTGINVKQGEISGTALTVGGTGTAGTITVKDNNGNVIGTWTKDGVSILKGSISGTSLTLGGNGNTGVMTVQNASGTQIGKWDNTGINVSRGVLNVGQFYTDDEYTQVGGFYVTNTEYGRDVFQTEDESCGMSADPGFSDGLWFWAGYNSDNDFDFAVNASGLCVARNFQILGGETLSHLMGRVDDLEDRVDALESGGPI